MSRPARPDRPDQTDNWDCRARRPDWRPARSLIGKSEYRAFDFSQARPGGRRPAIIAGAQLDVSPAQIITAEMTNQAVALDNPAFPEMAQPVGSEAGGIIPVGLRAAAPLAFDQAAGRIRPAPLVPAVFQRPAARHEPARRGRKSALGRAWFGARGNPVVGGKTFPELLANQFRRNGLGQIGQVQACIIKSRRSALLCFAETLLEMKALRNSRIRMAAAAGLSGAVGVDPVQIGGNVFPQFISQPDVRMALSGRAPASRGNSEMTMHMNANNRRAESMFIFFNFYGPKFNGARPSRPDLFRFGFRRSSSI